MAGMLPGVEAARRRRFSQTNNSNHGANSSLCLYERNHGFHIGSSCSSMRSSIGRQEEWDQNLDTVTREAKKRLDERLKSHLKSEIKRASQGQERSPPVKEGEKEQGTCLPMEQ